ncbi:MAG: LPS assembly lipoprotein LptE [Mesorhizobium sp.]
MSSSDRRSLRRFAALAVALSALGLSACTVRPLYSDAQFTSSTVPGGETVKSALASISIKPPVNRVGLEVRNQLIFLLRGDGSEPADPRYTLTQTVTAVNESSAIIQASRESEPTSAIMTVTSIYRLTETATGKVLATGKRSVGSSYDIPQQEFAALRAVRDAENRAARELADLLRLAIAQDLQTLPGS